MAIGPGRGSEGSESEGSGPGRGSEEIAERLRSGGLIQRLAEQTWDGVEKLKSSQAATGAALNKKFADDGDAFKGEMRFGRMADFFGSQSAFV
mgnify:CR=1 FL=1